jgi:hypothetical protein
LAAGKAWGEIKQLSKNRVRWRHFVNALCSSQCQLLRIEGVTWSAQQIPTAVNLGFLDRSRYFLEIAPQLSSRD